VDSSGGGRRVTLERLVSEDQGGGEPDLDVGVSLARAAGPGSPVEVLWTVRGNGADTRRLVFALQGDRHVDLGTGARRDDAGGPVDEYRMPLGAWVALLESPGAELYLDDVRFELTRKRELRSLAELMGLAGG
jgi:hypothetical protein